MEYNSEHIEEKQKGPSKAKPRVLLYTAVFFVASSIYTFDSFSTWKFLAVFIPLAFSFAAYKRKWIFLPVAVITWFAFMVMSVGVIYNHDLLELTGPMACPEGYHAEVRTLVENPVPGETYTSAKMLCVNDQGDRVNPGWSPHFILLGLYLVPALLLFFINVAYFKLGGKLITSPYVLYISGSVLYCFLARLLWINQDRIIGYIKTIF